MAPQEFAELRLTADVLGQGDTTGTFQLKRGSDREPFRIDTGIDMIHPVGQQGSGFLDTLANFSSAAAGDQPGRRDVIIDLGGGQHFVEINFSHNPQDSSITWGDGSGQIPADATGADHPLSQIDTFVWYLAVGTYDSRGAATLEYGEFSSGGAIEPLDAVPMGPNLSWNATGAQSSLSGSVRCIVTDLDPASATARSVI